MVVHVPHAVTLETKLCRQVKENILNLLLRQRNLRICSPGWVWLARTLTRWQDVVVVHAIVGGGGTRRSVSAVRNLRGRWAVATASHLAFVVAVVALIATAVVVHVGGPSHIRSHCEVTECLRVLLGISTHLALGVVAALALGVLSILIVILVIVVSVVVLAIVMASLVVPTILLVRVVGIGIVVATAQ